MSDTEIMDGIDEFQMDTPVRRPQKIIRETKINPEKHLENATVILDKKQKNLVNVYKNEKKVNIAVAPSYAKYFGRVMRVAINGIIVAVRCDGKDTALPESFAAEVRRRMMEMDKYELRLRKMSRVQSNFETSPGQLSFFG